MRFFDTENRFVFLYHLPYRFFVSLLFPLLPPFLLLFFSFLTNPDTMIQKNRRKKKKGRRGNLPQRLRHPPGAARVCKKESLSGRGLGFLFGRLKHGFEHVWWRCDGARDGLIIVGEKMLLRAPGVDVANHRANHPLQLFALVAIEAELLVGRHGRQIVTHASEKRAKLGVGAGHLVGLLVVKPRFGVWTGYHGVSSGMNVAGSVMSSPRSTSAVNDALMRSWAVVRI